MGYPNEHLVEAMRRERDNLRIGLQEVSNAWNGAESEAFRLREENRVLKNTCAKLLDDCLRSDSLAAQCWRPIESAPKNGGYNLLCDTSKPHLSGIFFGQVVDGKPWDCDRGVYKEADMWLPLIAPNPTKNGEL